MSAHGFGPQPDEALTPGELHELLHRLHCQEDEAVPADPYATVAAVCEATGEPPQRVWDVLQRMRDEDLRSRVEQRLKEAEEPLYRVERPGFSQDPLGRGSLAGRERAVTTILDRLPRVDAPQSTPPKKIESSRHQILSEWLASFILLGLTLMLLVLGWRFFGVEVTR
jgi:hypothetical protein